MRRLRLGPALGSTATVLGLLFVACSAASREKVLVYVFDGVPGMQERAQAEQHAELAAQAEAEARAAAAAAVAAAGGDAESAAGGGVRVALSGLPEPPVELETWTQALATLPADAGFGVDWVAAVEQKIIRPVGVVPSGKLPEPPFGLDDLAIFAAQIEPSRPVLDLDIQLRAPGADPIYDVRFPHSSHTVWLSCGSCHPGKLERNPTMRGIFRGASCGRCHGKVAFDPEFECQRCHTQLAPGEAETSPVGLDSSSRRPGSSAGDGPDRGRQLYDRLCAVCHGTGGDGKGPLAEELEIRPRDFRPGAFRFRSTLAPSLPTDDDLFRVISRGVPNSSMPSFARLSVADRRALVGVVKGFSSRFGREEPRAPLQIPPAPEMTAELAGRGAEVYSDIGCAACHGAAGGGDGPAAGVVRDALGFANPPLDFQSGRRIKSGERPEDLYRVIQTGLEGTPMPGFARALDPERTWELVAYVLSLRGTRRAPWAVKGDIRFERQGEQQEHPPAVFPHWKHRSRLKCSSCHPAIFDMRAGSTRIDMEAIRGGKYCGACHNGKIAWEAGFQTCVRCHRTN